MKTPLAQFGGVGGSLRTSWAERGVLPWIAQPKGDVGYLGWLRRGNLGDDAIFRSHVGSAANRVFRELPLTKPSFSLLSRRRVEVDTLVLGGGTVIGLDGWAHRVQTMLRAVRYRKFVVFGPGVEEVEFALSSGRGSHEGMEIWKSVLAQADFVGVRGPQSRASLERLGIGAMVVGDPALCVPLDSVRAVDTVGSNLICLNLTQAAVTLPRIEEWRRVICASIRTLVRNGYRLAVFGMDRGDVTSTLAHLRLVGIQPHLMVGHHSPARIVSLIRDSALVISERLHGAIFAANLSVPFLHLAYRPKSYDFAESISVTDRLIGIKKPSVDDVLESARGLLDEARVSSSQELSELRRIFAIEHGRCFG